MSTFARISNEEEEVTDEDAQFKELFMSKTEMEELGLGKDIPLFPMHYKCVREYVL